MTLDEIRTGRYVSQEEITFLLRYIERMAEENESMRLALRHVAAGGYDMRESAKNTLARLEEKS